MQNNATDHTDNNSLNAEVSGERVWGKELWPIPSAETHPCNF
jgi:hypothetical protein